MSVTQFLHDVMNWTVILYEELWEGVNGVKEGMSMVVFKFEDSNGIANRWKNVVLHILSCCKLSQQGKAILNK